MRLHSWAKKYGFVSISNGKLEDWIKYCLKGPILSIKDEEYKQLFTPETKIYLDQFGDRLRLIRAAQEPSASEQKIGEHDETDGIVYPRRPMMQTDKTWSVNAASGAPKAKGTGDRDDIPTTGA